MVGRPKRRSIPQPSSIRGAWLIPLGHDEVALVDAEDCERVSQHRWHLKGSGPYERYAVRTVNEPGGRTRTEAMHQAILGTSGLCDHINRDSLDNRRANLRSATAVENARNQSTKKNNTSGFKGVTWHVTRDYSRWWARISVNYVRMSLGTFDDPVEAACAYNAASIRLHGEFACLNRMD